MKKQVLFSVFFVVSILFSANVFAQYPIASYNTPVQEGTYFAETHTTAPTMSAEKRKLNVETTDPTTAATGGTVTFIVYSEDMQEFQGPFTLETGQSKQIEINEKNWVLYVLSTSGSKALMSVYTTSTDTE
jgi:hypothetical protein